MPPSKTGSNILLAGLCGGDGGWRADRAVVCRLGPSYLRQGGTAAPLLLGHGFGPCAVVQDPVEVALGLLKRLVSLPHPMGSLSGSGGAHLGCKFEVSAAAVGSV